jgi:hypothetical protein
MEAVLLQGERLNYPMFHKDLKLFRGVDNTIQFDLKDSDRKPVRMFNNTFKVIIVNPYNRQLMLTTYLFNEDERAGKYSLRLTPGDIQEWAGGFYHYSIILVDECGGEQMLFTTLDQDVTGRFELVDKPLPEFTPSHLIKTEDFTQIQFDSNPVTNKNFWISSRFAGDAQKNFADGLHTFSVLTENFSGHFWIEGSLEDNPTAAPAWFNISVDGISDVIKFTNSSQLDVFNFEGNYVWIRFRFQPDAYQTGNIKKVWLKN